MNTSPEEQNIPEVPAPEIAPEPVPTPEQSGSAQPEPGDVVISADQIDKLKTEKRQAVKAEVEKADDPPTSEAGATAEERSPADGEEPKKPRTAKKEPPAKESSPPESSAPESAAPHRTIDEGKLNGDVIDGILSEKKKEDRGVIISTAELEKYFGKEVTPTRMNEQIMALLDDWKEKLPSATAGLCMRRAFRPSTPLCIYLCFSMMRFPRSIKVGLICPVTCSPRSCAGSVRPLHDRGHEK